MQIDNDVILRLDKISKSFDSVEVLRDVDLSLKRGEVHAIIGQNGAGKSVLMKIISGVHKKSGGKIFYEGKEALFSSPIEARQCGIGMIYQEFSLIPTLTVAENIFLTREPKGFGKLIDDRKVKSEAVKILEDLGVFIDPDKRVQKLTASEKQVVEIGKVISQDRKIVIMDEPTASLTLSEVLTLYEIIRKLKKRGISILYITHYLREVFGICDTVSVLRDGQMIMTKATKDTDMSECISAMIGKRYSKSNIGPRHIKRTGTPMLEVKGLDLGGKEHIAFQLWPGEILGLAGLLGAGQEKVVDAIFGVLPCKNEVFKQGEKLRIRFPSDAIKHKIGMVPDDRLTEGLILEHNVKDNICLTIFEKLRGKFIDRKVTEEIAHSFVKKLSIKTRHINQKVRFLSGGNQQKVVIAKNLAFEPDILLLSDPNFGVDVGSKQEIVGIIKAFVSSGKSCIFISSEFEEIANVCDRILVVKDNIIIKELIEDQDNEFSEEMLLHAVQ